MRVVAGLAMMVSLLMLVTACWPFNTAPTALFTASPSSGPAPLAVNFSAMLSKDPDGDITAYEWSFGDGANGTGESVSHTYTTAGTFPVVLRVTDNDEAQDTARGTVTVLPGEENGDGGTGPTASFTATPLVGAAPLTVTFNASASVYAGHAITYYSWDFGDGVTGTGITTSHKYSPSTTTTYHVVLRIIASDNTEDTATKDITVTTSTPTPPSTAPTASFTANPNTGTAPKEIEFDPSASSAASGHSINTYVWNFGDQSSQTLTTATNVQHTYYTSQASHNFTITLTVIDDQGLTNSYSRTVTIKNYQPVAGFDVKLPSEATWKVKDLNIYNLGTTVQTVSVTFRSINPTDGSTWKLDPGTTPNANTSAEPGNFEPGTPGYVDGDKNLSYDVEGQKTASGWGITTYLWNYGDGQTATIAAVANGGCDTVPAGGTVADGHVHIYQWDGTKNSVTYDVVLEVVDAQGARSTITRQITLYKDP